MFIPLMLLAVAGHRPDHCQCNGRCGRQWNCLRERARLCRLAGPSAETDVDRGKHIFSLPNKRLDGSRFWSK